MYEMAVLLSLGTTAYDNLLMLQRLMAALTLEFKRVCQYLVY